MAEINLVEIEEMFQIGRFLEVLKKCYGIEDAFFEDVYDVTLRLSSGDLFGFQIESCTDKVIMFFFSPLPFEITENEFCVLGDSIGADVGKSNINVALMQDHGVVCFSIIESMSVSSEMLEGSLGDLLVNYGFVVKYIKSILN